MENKEILDQYEELFGELPRLPMMGNYGTILDDMKEAIIRKQPLTPDEVMEAFKEAGIPLDQGNEVYPED